MRFVSLFAGVGGFDLGLERAGMTCVGQVEIDKHATKILKKHWPDVPHHDDVRTAKEWADQNGLTGNVDLVCGGFPCQDVSVAGRRAGLAGNRSGLFWDALDYATHVKAQWIILENVPGLFSSNNGHDFAAVIGAIRDAGFHYVEWRVFDSQFYGVAQRRRRVFIVGHTGNPGRFPLFVERESSGGNPETVKQEGQAASASIASGTGSGVLGSNIVGTLAFRDYKGVGNQYVTENKLIVDTYVKAARAQSADSPETWRADDVHPTVNGFDIGDTRATALVVRIRAGKEGGGKGALVSEERSLTLATSNDQTLFTLFEADRRDGIRLHGDVAPTLQSFMGTGGNNVPMIEWTDGQVETFPLDLRNATRDPDKRDAQNRQGIGVGDSGDPAHTVTTAAVHGVAQPPSIVRRLTPTECERLQGFPDGWTDGQADSHRYKQMGNAVTVNVAHAVGQFIIESLK